MTDAEGMALALAQAAFARGRTSPNPPIGAVVVRQGRVLGEGCTQAPGQAHAEVMALASAVDRGHSTEGATVYVTLEPCCHHGRTPPCTDALIAAGVARVVYGAGDPNPAVNGGGAAALEAAGVAVDRAGVEACEAFLLGYLRAVQHGLPEVTAKIAMTLDGHLATAAGESKWITGPQARRIGHGLRGTHDAILVGVGTVLADNPSLNCRETEGADPVPVVLDTHGRLPADAALLTAGQRALVLTGDQTSIRALDADVVPIQSGPDGRLDIRAALTECARRGLHRVLVEGGAEVHRSLFDAALVDTLEVFLAPRLVPGGRGWLGGTPLGELADAVELEHLSTTPVGPDLHLRYAAKHRLCDQT